MSLKEDIKPYIDGDKLIAPAVVNPPNTYRTSDNGLLFTSIYYILLNQNGECQYDDQIEFGALVESCVGTDKHLHRAPNDMTQDEIDDNLGVLAGLSVFGMYPNFTLTTALYRFPQLVFSWLVNSDVSSVLLAPLTLLTAVIIATANMGAPATDSNSRQLNWLLWQSTKNKSWLCNLAGKIWYKRQQRVYNTSNVMKAVAAIYYPEGHPFISYWIE